MAPDIHIIARPGRPFASLFANNEAAADWIKRNVGKPVTPTMAFINPDVLTDYCTRIAAAGLRVAVTLPQATAQPRAADVFK